VKILFNSGDVKIKHVRTAYDGQVTGLVEDSEGSWSVGYNYRLRDIHGDEFLAELVEVVDEGSKTRLTFEK